MGMRMTMRKRTVIGVVGKSSELILNTEYGIRIANDSEWSVVVMLMENVEMRVGPSMMWCHGLT